MPRPGLNARSIALLVGYVSAMVVSGVSAVAGANYLLGEGGVRALAIGVGVAVAALFTLLGGLGLIVARHFRKETSFSTVLAIAGSVCLVGGFLGVTVGLQTLDRAVGIDVALTLLGAIATAVTLLPGFLQLYTISYALSGSGR